MAKLETCRSTNGNAAVLEECSKWKRRASVSGLCSRDDRCSEMTGLTEVNQLTDNYIITGLDRVAIQLLCFLTGYRERESRNERAKTKGTVAEDYNRGTTQHLMRSAPLSRVDSASSFSLPPLLEGL
ncbi:unnamed protein product [Nezara viridula]|uniref:Uncharacterized protein n=1 Tax=Nezara viridula TaxID=85310 RepID=A0A9P0E6I2_NEZVI|nr:unnamed protein product [Nezara viridula]